MRLLIALFTIFVISLNGEETASRYDGYKVFRVTPTTDEQINVLLKIEGDMNDFDFWKGPSHKNESVDIMVPPHKKDHFYDISRSLNLEAEVYIDNVQRLIDESSDEGRLGTGSFDWNSYHRGPEINAWLDSLAEKYPDKVQVVIGGKSYEGREIKGVKLSFGEGKKAIFLEGGIHAREWISPATVTYILNQLLTSEEPAIREIAQMYDWYVFPSVNPDGYEYTFAKNRLWRKTRKPYLGGLCYGADPNRNWGYHWMNGGASKIPCVETFAGSEAFSEPETKSLSEFITSISEKLVGYIGFHSYSQMLLLPYGDSPAHVENFDELYEIGVKATKKLAERYGTQYQVGNIVEIIYVASGGSMDWVKGTFHTPITFTYELRDTGRYGFVLPPSQIIPTAEETLDSLVVIVQEMNKKGY